MYEGSVGIIGNGFVGNAIYTNLKNKTDCKVYDIDASKRKKCWVRISFELWRNYERRFFFHSSSAKQLLRLKKLNISK